jgi:hypothetical protein
MAMKKPVKHQSCQPGLRTSGMLFIKKMRGQVTKKVTMPLTPPSAGGGHSTWRGVGGGGGVGGGHGK